MLIKLRQVLLIWILFLLNGSQAAVKWNIFGSRLKYGFLLHFELTV